MREYDLFIFNFVLESPFGFLACRSIENCPVIDRGNIQIMRHDDVAALLRTYIFPVDSKKAGVPALAMHHM